MRAAGMNHKGGFIRDRRPKMAAHFPARAMGGTVTLTPASTHDALSAPPVSGRAVVYVLPERSSLTAFFPGAAATLVAQAGGHKRNTAKP